MADLPTGTVTFLFSDIEGSSSLWEHDPQGMRAALEVHNAILHQEISANNGKVFKIVGDSFQAAFDDPSQALEAALDLQRTLSSADWVTGEPLRVRIGLHAGPAEALDDDYAVSHTLNRVARVTSAGHGGQVLLTSVVAELVGDKLPQDSSLSDLGEHLMKGLTRSEHLYQLISPDLPADFPPLNTRDNPRHNLPVQMTTFIGRETEIESIKTLLNEYRLVTLVGSGGVGKSRLAIESAHHVLDGYSSGIWLVQLAPLSESNLLPQSVAAALSVPEIKGRRLLATLTEFLQDKRCLLILDNCEHLLVDCASLAGHFLNSCPKLKILATSREALGLEGERYFHVPGLSLPDVGLATPQILGQSEAVQLFIERAQLALPDFHLNPDNAAALNRICTRLDGIPLAIELAAARINLLRLEQIDARLDKCFRLLTGGSSQVLPRQQTLWAAIDWSNDLLSDNERLLLQRLSVFSNGWDLDAAEAICAGDAVEAYTVLDLLDSLVHKSMVLADRRPGKETRYSLLETVRQYAREKYSDHGRTERTGQRHCEYYSSLIKRAHRERYGEGAKYGEEKWLDRIEIEHDNLRAALNWILGVKDAESGSQIIGALNWFWTMHDHYYEAREWSKQLLEICSPGSLAYATLLKIIGQQHFTIGNYEQGRTCLEESIILFHEFEEKHQLEEAIQSLGWIAAAQERYAESRKLLGQSLQLAQELEDNYRVAWAFLSLGELARAENNLDLAYQYHTQSLALMRAQNSRGGISIELGNLAFVVLNQGDYDRAKDLFTESLLISLDLGTKGSAAVDLAGLACIALKKGKAERAARLFGASESIHETLGRAIDPGDRADFENFQAATRALLSEEDFTAASKEGQSMTIGKAAAYALQEA